MKTLTTHIFDSTDPVWCCLRSLPKHEHIAARHLRRMVEGIDVFCPKLRIRRHTRRGIIPFTEALFPGYLFARFHPGQSMALVKSAPGIRTIVSFGSWIPQLSHDTIEGLRAHFD